MIDHQFFHNLYQHDITNVDIILFLSEYAQFNFTEVIIDDLVITYALQNKKSLALVTVQELRQLFAQKAQKSIDHFALLPESWYELLLQDVVQRFMLKIHRGQEKIEHQTILHTAPHHDDIVLGYHGYVEQLLSNNKNYVVYLTSGYRGVFDQFVIDCMHDVFMHYQDVQEYLPYNKERYDDALVLFGKSFRAQNSAGMHQARLKIMIQIVGLVFGFYNAQDTYQFFQQIYEQKSFDGFDRSLIDRLKSLLRESESDCKWRCLSQLPEQIIHARLGCYDDDTDDVMIESVQTMVTILRSIAPEIVTIAQDPCGVGPATHFVTSHVMMQALKIYQQECKKTVIKVVGYRNVWGAFTLAQTSKIIFVDKSLIATMHTIFMQCFASQVTPVVPSDLYEGGFSDIVEHFLEQQGQDIQTLLGVKSPEKKYALYVTEQVIV
jgi:glucosamine-6-phosphate deaminase